MPKSLDVQIAESWAQTQTLIPERMPKKQVKEVGLRLYQRRVALGISQRELAFPGCSYAYISRLEAGTRCPSLRTLLLLCVLLRTNPMWLLWGVGKEEAETFEGMYLVLDPRKRRAATTFITKRNALHRLLKRRAQLFSALFGPGKRR